MQHMKVSLTKELYENFSLFLYVSKAERGPWAQRMYVFQKQPSGDLTMLYNWPVSTGRELIEMAPSGSKAPSYTPQGYYEIDPDRVYKRYRSMQWDQSMPYAMFFNWEHDGLQTGLAIHGATGTDIALLGKRSSAGCVRIDPQNAQLLYRLIRTDYKGLAPRFAYDRRTATMSNDGLLMHDKAGQPAIRRRLQGSRLHREQWRRQRHRGVVLCRGFEVRDITDIGVFRELRNQNDTSRGAVRTAQSPRRSRRSDFPSRYRSAPKRPHRSARAPIGECPSLPSRAPARHRRFPPHP